MSLVTNTKESNMLWAIKERKATLYAVWVTKRKGDISVCGL